MAGTIVVHDACPTAVVSRLQFAVTCLPRQLADLNTPFHLARRIALIIGRKLTPPHIMLRQIRDPRVRNLVRGALTPKGDQTFKRTMERLRKESDQHDASLAFRYLLESPLAHAIARPESFPDSTSEIDKIPFFDTASLEIELASVRLRLQRDSERLSASIRLVGQLNQSILAKDHSATSRHLSEYRERFGLSLLVAAKAMGVRHGGSDDAGRKAYGDFIAAFQTPRRHVVAVAMEDSLDPERNYILARRGFMGFVAEERLQQSDLHIIVDLFSPLAIDVSPVSQRLQAYARWSLLDATAYMFRLRKLAAKLGNLADVDLIDAALPQEISDVWSETFGRLELQSYQRLVVSDDDWFADYTLFSHAAAWSEYESIYDYRLRVEQAIGARLDGRFTAVCNEASGFITPATSIDELLLSDTPEIGLQSVAPSKCGLFHRSIALISALENGGLSGITGEKLAALLDQTVDVASLVTRAELNDFLPRRPSDLLYEYLRTALIEDLESNKVSHHGMRRALEKLVQVRFAGDMVKLLQHLDTPICHAAGHLYHTCTEAFLTELYGLYRQAGQVTEAQASILEWRGTRMDDNDARIRAKSHRLNLRLRKVRGAIEETRIYVDPLRFTEWVLEHMTSELRTLALQSDEILEDTDRSISLKDPVRITVEPRLQLLKVLDDCYSEFCTNKIYGVTSFIGRRIRHGTLHGHLVLEFQPEVQKAVSDFQVCAPRFSAYLDSWVQRFEAAVLQIVSDQIHVRSKEKPRGLIIATVDDPDKFVAANLMLNEVALSLNEGASLSRSVAQIREYCWLLFEADLKRTREAVEKLRRSFLFDLEAFKTNDPSVDRKINEQVRALNTALQQRFDGVRSWFTRPTNLSPSASVEMLFSAVLDEVKQRHSDFDPVIERNMPDEVDLIGHRFHFFYDALYILVQNVAEHGKRRGVLRLTSALDLSNDKYTDLSIEIMSEFDTGEMERDVELIENAMRAEIGDAMVENKKSGIRKLRGLVDDVEEILALEHRYEGCNVVFAIKMRYPRS